MIINKMNQSLSPTDETEETHKEIRGTSDVRFMAYMNIPQKKCCCFTLRTSTRVACIIDMLFKATSTLELMKGGQFAIILLLVPSLMLLASTFTNDTKLALMGFTFHNAVNKTIIVAALMLIVLSWIALDLLDYEGDLEIGAICVDLIITLLRTLLEVVNKEELKNFFLSMIICYPPIIVICQYFNYLMYNYSKCLVNLDWERMDGNREAFFRYGSPIPEESTDIFQEDLKFCFCCTRTSTRSCCRSLRSRTQELLFYDIVSKVAGAAISNAGEGKDAVPLILLTLASLFCMICTYNEDYRMAKFAYYFNVVSMYLSILTAIAGIIFYGISINDDLNQTYTHIEECDKVINAGLVLRDIAKIVLSLWTIWCSYRSNYMVYSFLIQLGKKNYAELDGPYREEETKKAQEELLKENVKEGDSMNENIINRSTP